MSSTERQHSQSRTYRVVTCVVGVLFLVLGLAILVVTEFSLETVIAGIVVGGLGLDAMVSAFRHKESLLARIGPLP